MWWERRGRRDLRTPCLRSETWGEVRRGLWRVVFGARYNHRERVG